MSADASKTVAPENSPKAAAADSVKSDAAARNTASLPDAPIAKTAEDAKSNDGTAIEPSAESISPGISAFSGSAVRPAGRTVLETPRERAAWFGLLAVSHAAAGFDAYSTRLAVSGHYGLEGNPLLRPFSHSNAMYAATQVSPVVMDYVGHRMLKSRNSVIRRCWWIPQTAGASFSLSAGIHNYRLVH